MKLSVLGVFTIFLIFLSGCRSQSIRKLESPVGQSSHLPYLTTNKQGSVFLSWVEQVDKSNVALKYARLENEIWTEPKLIAEGDDWFVNWADFPSLLVSDDAPIAAHWLHKIPGNTYSYEINLSMTGPANQWQTVVTPHKDGTATEHGFVSMLAWKDSSVLAVWLDGRQTANRAEDEYSDLSKAMTIRSAVITSDGNVTQRKLIDDSVCDCCQTSLARTRTGAVAAYRNRTDSEIRDIYVSRFIDGMWSDPVPVHNDGWQIGGCPVDGPAVAAHGDTVLVTWPTGANNNNNVKASFSYDGGISFQPPVIIDDGNPIGRVDASFVNKDHAVISWIEKSGNGAEIKIRLLKTGETVKLNSSKSIGNIDPDRGSGFPQLEVSKNKAIIAWTNTGKKSEIKLSAVPLQLPVNE